LKDDNGYSNVQNMINVPARNSSENFTFSEWEDDKIDTKQSRNKEVKDYKNKYFKVQNDKMLEFWIN